MGKNRYEAYAIVAGNLVDCTVLEESGAWLWKRYKVRCKGSGLRYRTFFSIGEPKPKGLLTVRRVIPKV